MCKCSRSSVEFFGHVLGRNRGYIDGKIAEVGQKALEQGQIADRIMYVVWEDVKIVGARKQDAEDRVRWRQLICFGNP